MSFDNKTPAGELKLSLDAGGTSARVVHQPEWVPWKSGAPLLPSPAVPAGRWRHLDHD
jgi:hypothetical protein